MPKYLLPCECGKGIEIDVSQAGQRISCECGKLVEVPTLRGLRALGPARETQSASRSPAEWDSSRGMIFAGSLILFVIGATVSYFGNAGLQGTPNITREVERETFETAIDDMSLDEVYETWQSIRDHGIGQRGENLYVNLRNFRAGRQRMLVVGIVLCTAGILGAVGSMLGRRLSSV